MVHGRQYDQWNHTAQICTIFQATMSSKISPGKIREMYCSLHPLMSRNNQLPKADISVLKSVFVDKSTDKLKGLSVGNTT
jgi:hypothetical protein